MAKRTGLFGGTFDPVHNGHVSIVKSFLQSPFIDELWILLTPFPPHKRDKEHASFEVRFEMLEKAFSGIKGVSISRIETELQKPSYTIQTLQYLKKHYPSRSFYYCMGEDSLAEFHTWKDYQEILHFCKLLVAHRPDSGHSSVDQEILSKTCFVDHTPVDISSSEIRNRVETGQSIKDLVPRDIKSIIEKEDLYR